MTSPIKNVSAGVIGLRIGDCRLPIERKRPGLALNLCQSVFICGWTQLSLVFSTVVIADFSISIFTLSATFTITVVSFTLEMSP